MRVRFVVEAEVTDPPPDYLAKLTKVVQRECRFMLGNSAEVVSSEWLETKEVLTPTGWRRVVVENGDGSVTDARQ